MAPPLSNKIQTLAVLGTQDYIDVGDSQSLRGMNELLLKVLVMTAISLGAGLKQLCNNYQEALTPT